MADNHLCTLNCHHIFKHGEKNYPNFDYDENNQISDQGKTDASVRISGGVSQLKDIKSDTKSRRDAGNQAQTDISVHSGIF